MCFFVLFSCHLEWTVNATQQKHHPLYQCLSTLVLKTHYPACFKCPPCSDTPDSYEQVITRLLQFG